MALASGDTRGALQSIKLKLDLLKLVNPNKASLKSLSVTNNNINLPSMTAYEIRVLLGRKTEENSTMTEKVDYEISNETPE